MDYDFNLLFKQKKVSYKVSHIFELKVKDRKPKQLWLKLGSGLDYKIYLYLFHEVT